MVDSALSWVRIPTSSGEQIGRTVVERVAERIKAGDYSADDAAYISKVNLSPIRGALDISDTHLEKIRRLCQLWDVDLRMTQITSHRKIIGPVIVAAKKVLYPVLRIFLRDFIRQQRAFNAATISLLVDACPKKPITKE